MSSQSTVAPRTFRPHATEIARHSSPLSGRRRVWQPRARQACDKCRVHRKRCYRENISEPCVRCRSSGVECQFANRRKSQTTRNSTTPCSLPLTPTASHGGGHSTDDSGLASSSSSSSPDPIWDLMQRDAEQTFPQANDDAAQMPALQDPFHSLEALPSPSPLPPPLLSLPAFATPNAAPQTTAELVPGMLGGGGYSVRPLQQRPTPTPTPTPTHDGPPALLPVAGDAGVGMGVGVDMGVGMDMDMDMDMDMGPAQLLLDLTLWRCIDWERYYSQHRKAGRFAAAT